MKRVIKFLTSIGAAAFLLGFLVSTAERKANKTKETEEHRAYGPYEEHFKRPLDFAAALLGFVFLSPVIGAVALLVWLKLGRPALFTQERPGKIDPETGRERIFKLYKFRTMTDARDRNGELLSDAERLTAFGRKLRSTSLDELPELFNILKGDMSFVGPRPLLVEYLPRYNKRQARRHEVRPGLTGLAQVNGRNAISWEERFEWDVKYVEKITFLTDVKILFETAGAVLKREGISSEASATMEKFGG